MSDMSVNEDRLSSMDASTSRQEPDVVSYQQLKESIGSMFVLWSRVEDELGRAITSLCDDPKKPRFQGISGMLRMWEDLYAAPSQRLPGSEARVAAVVIPLTNALDIRNRVAHGLKGFSVGKDASSTVLFSELNGVPKAISYDDMMRTLKALNRAVAAIRFLTAAASKHDEWRTAKGSAPEFEKIS